MSEVCTFPLCKYPESRGGFCLHHAKHFAGEKIKEVKKPIAKQSEKRKEDHQEYKKIVKDMLKDGAQCKIGAPGCIKIPSGLHHRQKRSPKNLLDRKNLVPCCSPCNLWIEENSKEAIEKGYTKSRFKD